MLFILNLVCGTLAIRFTIHNVHQYVVLLILFYFIKKKKKRFAVLYVYVVVIK